MAKIDIISGFLGAGKTTLIKKLLEEAYKGEKLVLIENEFGEIGIDGGFLKDSGIKINEMNSGCICCSLVGDFGKALKQVTTEYAPDRIIIEPSGVGKLSDVIKAVIRAGEEVELEPGYFVTVADASKTRVYMKNFGEFYNDQIESAATIILSRTGNISQEKLDQAVELIKGKNDHAPIITTPWDQISAASMIEAMEGTSLSEKLLMEERFHHHDEDEDEHEHHHHHHHDHDDDDDDECCCGHDHHHHDDDDDECCCGHDHEHHHHDHDEEGHEHHHHHHHGHDADEVFTSWGAETTHRFTKEGLEAILEKLDSSRFGLILRAKGIVQAEDGSWLHFDYVPEEIEVRQGPADYTGRLCVIGSKLDEESLKELFGL